ncbi:hypothetical protein ASG43_15450 [Aureimonas sp. Leaf454]|uniref:DUF2141 domain-containing protein n=1 Tax=Aureimonas sp. Leaf454 TaxID=1736381 RepID=UPI000715E69C|nr:DUF2141 domain-containing protein [Aureimonas sp. Leaf454]KQT42944.1 hypothetical protein ASG43_15450 [Aureimonas sp. Leaf454]
MRYHLTLAALAVSTGIASAGDLSLSIDGLRNRQGNVSICLFLRQGRFPDCADPSSTVRRTVPAKAAGTPILFRDLPPGTYAVTVLHDEDADGALDSNLLGIPREGIGITNNRLPRFSAPTYADAAFDLPAGRRQSVTLVYW